MTDSFASHRSIRAQLESNFDDYLGMIVDYLSVEYSDLQLSQELSNELAATVIVRMSHAKPEPADLDAALFAAADELVAVRRQQLSRASRASGESLDFASDSPTSVPSLRLIQRPRGRAISYDATEADAADALSSGRLSLADPPLDLSRTLGLRSERTNRQSEPQPAPNSETQKVNSTSVEAAFVTSEPDPTNVRAPSAREEDDAVRAVSPADAKQTATEAEQNAARAEQTAAQAEPTLAEEPSTIAGQPKARRKTTPLQAERWRKRSRDGNRTDRREVLSAPGLGLRALPLGPEGNPTLPDEIAMLAMMGYPNNPNRAARLCVVALAEELEIEPRVDLSSQMERVTLALECLASTLLHAGVSPKDAAMEWQRVARKATLQAFFCDRI